jgi:hypothetical protein
MGLQSCEFLAKNPTCWIAGLVVVLLFDSRREQALVQQEEQVVITVPLVLQLLQHHVQKVCDVAMPAEV